MEISKRRPAVAPLVIDHDEKAVVAMAESMELWQSSIGLEFRARVNLRRLADAIGPVAFAQLRIGALAVSPRFIANASYFERPYGMTAVQHITDALLGHIAVCADGGALPGAGCWFER